MSLPIHGRVVHGISTALAHLDADGATVTAGVTPLGADGGASAGVRRPRRPEQSRHAHPEPGGEAAGPMTATPRLSLLPEGDSSLS
jgi:hypothetical protein